MLKAHPCIKHACIVLGLLLVAAGLVEFVMRDVFGGHKPDARELAAELNQIMPTDGVLESESSNDAICGADSPSRLAGVKRKYSFPTQQSGEAVFLSAVQREGTGMERRFSSNQDNGIEGTLAVGRLAGERFPGLERARPSRKTRC